ncbi:MAG: hypothetical protein JO189_04185 [Deltaproteobacteria bacterium]|nr:hypothetical protein [Deltaproteobacteria bacterium]
MSTSEDRRQLESELKASTDDLREDAAQISSKIDETKAMLNPINLVRERPILSSGVALVLGLVLGYLLGRRKLPAETVMQPVVEHLGKPMARQILTTAAKEATMRAIRGK